MKKLVKATQDTDIYDESIEQNLNAVRECETREEMVALLKTTNKLMLVFMADLPDNGISRLTKQDLIDEVIARINQERMTAEMLKQVQESKTAVEVSAILEYATTSQMLDIAKKLSISAYFNEFSTKAELIELITEKVCEIAAEQRKETATKLAGMGLAEFSMNVLEYYAKALCVSFNKDTTKAELIEAITTKLADDLSIAYARKATFEELVKIVKDKACLNMDIGCIDNVVRRLYSAKCEADRLYILAEFSMEFTAKMYYLAFGKKPSCYAKKVKNHRLGTFIMMDWEIDFANTDFQPAVWLENCDERLTELNDELATTEWQLTRCRETNRECLVADFLSRKSEFQDEVRFYETWRKALVKSA